jgi:hypothetical protein
VKPHGNQHRSDRKRSPRSGLVQLLLERTRQLRFCSRLCVMGGAPLSVTLAVQTIVRMKVKPANWAIVWTHFALGLIIVAEITFIILGMRFIAPGCRRVLTYVDTDVSGFYAFMPGATYLLGLLHSIAYQTGWWLIAFAIAWALFEWRVPREGKQGLRLSALTSLALL